MTQLSLHSLDPARPAAFRPLTRLTLPEAVFAGLLFLMALVPYFVLVRQLGYFEAAHIYKVINPLILLLLAGWIVSLIVTDPRRLLLDSRSLLLLAMGLYGAVIGFGYLMVQPDYGFRQYIAHGFAAVYAAVVYTSYLNSGVRTNVLVSLLERFSILIFIGYCICLGLIYAAFLEPGFYLGFYSGTLLIPFSLYLLRKRYLMVLATIVLIFVSGKRGTLIVVPLLLLVALYLDGLTLRRLLAAGLIVAAVAAVGAAMVMLPVVTDAPAIARILSLAPLFDPDASVRELANATSGRNLELIHAFGLATRLDAWITGLGFGFGFPVFDVDGEFLRWQHYVHITPINYALQYGVPLAALFYAFYLGGLVLATIRGRRAGEAFRWLVLMGWAYLALSMTSFVPQVDTLYWAVLGLLLSPRLGGEERTAPARPGPGARVA